MAQATTKRNGKRTAAKRTPKSKVTHTGIHPDFLPARVRVVGKGWKNDPCYHKTGLLFIEEENEFVKFADGEVLGIALSDLEMLPPYKVGDTIQYTFEDTYVFRIEKIETRQRNCCPVPDRVPHYIGHWKGEEIEVATDDEVFDATL